MNESRNKKVSNIFKKVTLVFSGAFFVPILIYTFMNEYTSDVFFAIIFIVIPALIIYYVLYLITIIVFSIINKTSIGFKHEIIILPIISFFLGIIFLIIKETYVDRLKEEPIFMSAGLIESQSGCIHNSYNIDFKMNYRVLFSESHKFSDEFYWGNYTLSGDTVIIDIKKSILKHNVGIINHDTLTFIGDDLIYLVSKE
jgi:hypothetical protein